jgi:diguanylate cyclase (GGDEF)-like protein
MRITSKDFLTLSTSRLFAEVPAATLRGILSDAVPHEVTTGTRIIAPGKPNHSMYIVIHGELGVFADDDANLALSKTGPGDCVGEQSILDHGTPAALVIATRPSRLAVVRAEQMWEAMCRAPVIALNLLRILSERIRHDNANLRESYARQTMFETAAGTDSLTGLHNRHWMEDTFARELQRCNHAGSAAALFMIDIDHFKKVNDRFGHRVGDAVLVHFAETMRRALRPRDLCARFGGEEFSVLLPGVSPRKALQAAERLRTRIQSQPMRVRADSVVSYTVSIGIAEWRPGSELADLVQIADDALYAAKRAGRNRTELAVVTEPRRIATSTR